MVDYRAKFDSQLRDIHTSFLDIQRANRDRVYPLHSAALHGGPVSLLLQFGDDLAGIEARGFRTRWAEGNFARGDVAPADLEAVARHPQVIQLEYGGRLKPSLDTSAKEIKARGPDLTKAVWNVDTSTGAFKGNRGAGVLIGVIDTGIDITHPVFIKPSGTDTRIKRIWDMGIDPHDGIKGPDVSWLPSGLAYGVVYTDQMINAVLRKTPGRKTVKHQDCYGHGTYAASVAAGNGSAARSGKKFEFVGVAPEADLIIVKIFFLLKEPKRNGVALELGELLEDAISYITRVAKDEFNERTVVMNASLGMEFGPHDGLTASDLRIEAQFRGATKKVLVAAAGNEAEGRQHAVITMPASKTIDVPFTLYDERDVTSDKAHCVDRQNAAPELEIQFWYRQLGPQQKLDSLLTLPGAKSPTPGPALGGHVDGTYRGKHPFRITHDGDATKRPPATPVTRNVLRIKVTPLANKFGTGPCTLQLTGPAQTVIHVWGRQDQPPNGFRIGHDDPASEDGGMLPLPAGMVEASTSTISYPGTSAGAVAVAAYDDTDSGHAIASFSSQGPLVDYSGSGPYVAKPDLAAPGVEIEAATASDSLVRAFAKKAKKDYAPYASNNGTSAAAPHVSGVAALMFEKNASLARDELVKQLRNHARPPQQADTFGAGRVDAKASRDAV
jgi:subtilisin family serine protease